MDTVTFSAFGPTASPGSNATTAVVVAAEWAFDFDQLGPTLSVFMAGLQQIAANAGGGGIQLRYSSVAGDTGGTVIASVVAPPGGTGGVLVAATSVIAFANPGGTKYLTFTTQGATGPTTLTFRGLLAVFSTDAIDDCPVTATTRLIQMRLTAKTLADKLSDTSISDDSWDGFINDGIEDGWKRIVEATGDAFLKNVDFTLAGGITGNTYDVTTIPAGDFRRVKFLEVDPTLPQRRRVKPFNFLEKDRGSARPNPVMRIWDSDRRYRRMGNLIYVERYEIAAGNYRLWYIPSTPKLVNKCDALPVVLDEWAEYFPIFAAMKALGIEESDPGALPTRLQELRDDIAALKGEPDDDADASTIADVEDEEGNGWNWP